MGESDKKSTWRIPGTILAVVGLLAVYIIPPNLIKQPIPRRPCIDIMRELQGAKEVWAAETGKTNGTVASINDIRRYVKWDEHGNLPTCPLGGQYTIGKVGEPVTCSLGTMSRAHVLPWP